MVIVLVLAVIIIGLFFKSIRSCSVDQWRSRYMDIPTSQTVKGFFVILVFLSHFSAYVTVSDPVDTPLISFCRFFGQLIVTPFFFYSGYGVYESVKKKGKGYIQSFPKKRILKTLVHFDLAIVLFLILNCAIGVHYDLERILLSFFAWEDIGNSNWFIFAILITYLFSFIAFKLKIKPIHSILAVLVLTLVYMAVLYYLRKSEPWWYNTIICYPLGMLYSCFREQIETKVLSTKKVFVPVFIVALAGFVMATLYADLFTTAMFQVRVIFFTILLVAWTRLIPESNGVLKWFGNHVFEIYVLQRIPMIAFEYLGFADYLYEYFALCTVCTLLIAVLFKRVVGYLDSKLFA